MSTCTKLTAIVFLSLLSLIGCKKSDDVVTPMADEKETIVAPEPSYFDGYTFQPKVLDDDNYRVLVNFCNAQLPRDTDISIWNFAPDTNMDEDLASVVRPGYDDDGEPIEPDSPDYYITAQAKYVATDGSKMSDFNKKMQFAVDLEKNVICVIVYYDASDVPIYTVIDTRNSVTVPASACLRSN